jgi:hypothetical protein
MLLGSIPLLGNAFSQQTPLGADFETLRPYVIHEERGLRRAAVLILTDALLNEPQPHSGDAQTNARDVLSGMRAADLDVVFERCRVAWLSIPPTRRMHGPASHYEQLERLKYVMRRMKSLESFAFDSYVQIRHSTLSMLALAGMVIRDNPADRKQLDEYAAGPDPIRSWARDAIGRPTATGPPPLPVRDAVFPDNAGNKWVYDELQSLQEKGLLIGYNIRIGHIVHHTRYSLATAINSAFHKIASIVERLEFAFKAVQRSNLPIRYSQQVLAGLAKNARALQDSLSDEDLENLQRLITAFKWDLEALGSNTTSMKLKIRDWIN